MKPFSEAVIGVAACALAVASLSAQQVSAQAIPNRPESLLARPVADFVVPYGAVRERVLPNGLTLVALEDPTVPLVDIAIALRVGSFLEDQGVFGGGSEVQLSLAPRPGMMSIVATMLRRGGTEAMSPEELDAATESRGVKIQSFGGRHRSGVVGSAVNSDFDLLSEWMADVLARPAFDPAVLARYRQSALHSLALRANDAVSLAEREWNALVFGRDHPRIRPLRPADVERWTPAALRSQHARYYCPEDTVIAIAGGVSASTALDRFTQLLGEWQSVDCGSTVSADLAASTRTTRATNSNQPAAPGLYQAVLGLAQGTLLVGHLGELRRSWFDADADAAELLAEILAGPGPVSRLRGRLRDRDGLVYSVSGSVGVGGNEKGLVQLAWQVDPANGLEALSAAMEEVRRLREQPPPQHELGVARAALTDALPTLFDTAEKIAGRYAEDILLGRPHEFWRRYASRLATVTPEQVQRSAQKMLRPEDFLAVWVGPRLPSKELRRLGFRKVEDLPQRDPSTLALIEPLRP